MIFYHYTTRSAIRSILEQGLTQGEAPLSHTRVARAINLTTDPDPSGHGLDMGGRIVTAEESALLASKGFIVPPGTVYANKREARIRIKSHHQIQNLSIGAHGHASTASRGIQIS